MRIKQSRNIKFFTCPECGERSVSVGFGKDIVSELECGNCNTKSKVPMNSIRDFKCPTCQQKYYESKEKGFGNFKRKDFKNTVIKCSHIDNESEKECGLQDEFLVSKGAENVDAFGVFIDTYYVDQEINRLERKLKKLKENDELSDLILTYSILGELCSKKADVLESEDVDKESIDKWKDKSKEYYKLKKEILDEIEKSDTKYAISSEDEDKFSKSESGMKKEKTIKEVFGDNTGFLEF